MGFPVRFMDKAAKAGPYFDRSGIPYVVGAAVGGTCLIGFQILLADGATQTVTFADLGLPDMADDQYAISCDGETSNRLKVDQDTITTAGFDILGGDSGGGETAHVIIVGRMSGVGSSDPSATGL